jgi:hypothetical protein
MTELLSVALNKVIKVNPLSDRVRQISKDLQEMCDAVKISISITGFK